MSAFRFAPTIEQVAKQLQGRIDRARSNPEHDGSDFSDVDRLIARLADRDRHLEDYLSSHTVSPVPYRAVGVVGGNGAITYASVYNPLVYTKRADGTSLLIHGTITGFATNAVGLSIIGVNVNGVDYDVGQYLFNVLNDHRTIGIVSALIPGLPAGAITLQPRVRAQVLNSPIFNVDANDQIEFTVQEVGS